MKKFGGTWTEEKLETFEKYVKAYLSILNKAKIKYRWKTIYFDGFAGFGERLDKIPKQNSIFDFLYDKESRKELSVYQGSADRILGFPEPHKFDWYYFIDNNENYITNLKKLVESKYQSLSKKIIIRNDDCNNQLTLLSKFLHENKKYAALILLDPFGMQVNWDSIAKFKDTRSDIWILLPSGVAINRLLPKSGLLNNEKKLEDFFGYSVDEIKNIFYKRTKVYTLFGEEDKTNKIANPINKIVQIYIKQLKSIWNYVTEKPLVLLNSKNVPIFHFLFASNNKTGLKIASSIISKK